MKVIDAEKHVCTQCDELGRASLDIDGVRHDITITDGGAAGIVYQPHRTLTSRQIDSLNVWFARNAETVRRTHCTWSPEKGVTR